MGDISRSSRPPAEHVAFTAQIDRWLMAAGVANADDRATLAVGLADSLRAAGQIATALDALLATDPRSTSGADEALTHLARMHVEMFNELKDHVAEMEPLWEGVLVEAVAARLPDDHTGPGSNP